MLKTRFLKRVVNLILILCLLSANLNIAIMGTISYALNVGDTMYISTVTGNPNLYCINKGLFPNVGHNYYCYSKGNSTYLACLVSMQTNSNRDDNDPVANAIWKNWGYTPNVDVTYLENQAMALTNMSNAIGAGNVSITGPTGVLEEASSYGPFTVYYPTYNGVLAGDYCNLYINDRPVLLPTNGQQFVIPEDIIYVDAYNTIRIEYQGTKYSGEVSYLTPPVTLRKIVTCSTCGKDVLYNATGYATVGRSDSDYYVSVSENDIVLDSPWSPASNGLDLWVYPGYYNAGYFDGEHENCSTELDPENMSGAIYYPDTHQNVIYVEPTTETVRTSDSLTFYVERTTINISGQVWLDGQTGIKPVQEPNGIKDRTEQGLSGIEVVLRDGYHNAVQTTSTDSNGNYSFTDVEADESYYVEFNYDGIKYIATNTSGDSDASENGREAYNSKFKTFTKDYVIAENGRKTSLTYTNNGLDTSGDEFKITATTSPTVYSEDVTGLNLGLVKKTVDLAAVTDLYSAKVTINGESKEYSYNDLNQLPKDENGNPKLENAEKGVNYNLYLYNSDYNYRIKDYDLPNAAHEGMLNTEEQDLLLEQRKQDKELEAELTYQILLNNQSATDATINQIAYYYDTNYVLEGAKPELVNINGKMYNKVIFDINHTFTSTNNQGVAQVTFKVGKDSAGNLQTGTFENWVEITKYSTNNSCVDNDSIPGNITGNINEDDTDNANGINIQINNISREITGYVFEDMKDTSTANNTGNGKLDTNEPKVNDVIVQLIEIKNIDTNGDGHKDTKLEYIWQETVSGSDTVRYVTNDGTQEGSYTVSNEKGHYTFNQNIIPGNYIVRFIYGDGTYYDATSATNITKYNGQDYKSTIDLGYKEEQFNQVIYGENNSARDNEARRLEVMNYAVNVSNPSDLIIDSKEKLENTWMCAETSAINMKVSSADLEGDSTSSIKNNVNFGLIERPIIQLELEKHITGLKISGTNGVHVSTDLNAYDKALQEFGGIFSTNKDINVKLDSKNVKATATNKANNKRGKWTFETLIDKLAGERLEITYSYRVKNIGDPDYITTTLENAGKTYKEIAEGIKNNADPDYTIGKYLGTTYYTGQKSDNEHVTSIYYQIEDYISTTNGTQLDKTMGNFKQVKDSEAKAIWKYEDTISDDKRTMIGTENVQIVQSEPLQYTGNEQPLTSRIYVEHLDTTTTSENLTFRSYVAQLIYPTNGRITSETGILYYGLSNLQQVQSYVEESSVSMIELAPEADEFVGETVIITMDTGMDKITIIILTLSIIAGLAVIGAGIILIKKHVIK